MAAGGGNNSSDFVSLASPLPSTQFPRPKGRDTQQDTWTNHKIRLTGSQALQVCISTRHSDYAMVLVADHPHPRMLEEPNYTTVVRWGDDGTSFVVLEVRQYFSSLLWWAAGDSAVNQESDCRMRDSPSPSYPNISSTATLPALSDSSTSMTFTRCDKMRKMGCPHMALR